MIYAQDYGQGRGPTLIVVDVVIEESATKIRRGHSIIFFELPSEVYVKLVPVCSTTTDRYHGELRDEQLYASPHS